MVKGYFSYLLRIWRTGVGLEAVWYASVEEVATGEHKAFAHLDALLAYLREQTSGSSPSEENTRAEITPDHGEDTEPPGEDSS